MQVFSVQQQLLWVVGTAAVVRLVYSWWLVVYGWWLVATYCPGWAPAVLCLLRLLLAGQTGQARPCWQASHETVHVAQGIWVLFGMG